MIYPEKKIMLKTGKIAMLKTPGTEDAGILLDCIKTSCGETDYLLRYEDDWADFKTEDEAEWLENCRQDENFLFIACYIDGEIAGNCNISFMNGSKTFHRASVGITVRKKYWSLGIGSAMLSELIKAAEQHDKTEIVELEYISGNDRAGALYEKFGFKVTAEISEMYKLKNGTYQNAVFMQKKLSETK